jgi:hypothetical protein
VERDAMWFDPQAHGSPEELPYTIRGAGAATPELLSAVADLMRARCATAPRSEQTRRFDQLVASRAWTDAALGLLDLDRSHAIRRLSFDEGEWHCTLGSQWPVPEWLDDTVEFGHAVLPLAILGALVESLRWRAPAAAPTTSVPRSRSDLSEALGAVSCDNFA